MKKTKAKTETKIIWSYPTIDANGIIAINTNIAKATFTNNNFYVDKNPYSAFIADPCTSLYCSLFSIYMIEDGNIYVAGIKVKAFTKFGTSALEYPIKMDTWLCFDNIDEYLKDKNKIKFNPNYFSQERLFRFKGTLSRDEELFYKYCNKNKSMTLYDLPNNFIQEVMFIKGVEDAIRFNLNRDDLKKIIESFNTRVYFSLESFYINGIAAVLIEKGDK